MHANNMMIDCLHRPGSVKKGGGICMGEIYMGADCNKMAMKSGSHSIVRSIGNIFRGIYVIKWVNM